VAVIIILIVGPGSPVALIWLYAITMGLGGGSWLPTSAMLTSTRFGLADYGSIFGLVTLSIMAGTATGPLLAGYMYDATNTYQWAFTIFLVLYMISIPAVLVLRRPKSP
ncbi:MFS transporter, partial [Chloroflexota bacterium]